MLIGAVRKVISDSALETTRLPELTPAQGIQSVQCSQAEKLSGELQYSFASLLPIVKLKLRGYSQWVRISPGESWAPTGTV